MSLTTKSLGRGRRVAAGSLIAVAALALTACEGGPDAASRPSSAASATSHDKATAGSSSSEGGAQASGAKEQSGAGGQRPSGKSAPPPGGKPTDKAPSAAEAHTSTEATSDRCTAANMSLRLGAADAGAGNIRYPLVFTNKGKKACSLRGFPGVSLINRDGSTVGKPATRGGGAGAVVRLQPGQSAHALLHTVNDGVSDTPCWADSQLVFVYPPGSKEPMTTGSRGLRVCGGRFDVTAVEAGSLG